MLERLGEIDPRDFCQKHSGATIADDGIAKGRPGVSMPGRLAYHVGMFCADYTLCKRNSRRSIFC